VLGVVAALVLEERYIRGRIKASELPGAPNYAQPRKLFGDLACSWKRWAGTGQAPGDASRDPSQSRASARTMGIRDRTASLGTQRGERSHRLVAYVLRSAVEGASAAFNRERRPGYGHCGSQACRSRRTDSGWCSCHRRKSILKPSRLFAVILRVYIGIAGELLTLIAFVVYLRRRKTIVAGSATETAVVGLVPGGAGVGRRPSSAYFAWRRCTT